MSPQAMKAPMLGITMALIERPIRMIVFLNFIGPVLCSCIISTNI